MPPRLVHYTDLFMLPPIAPGGTPVVIEEKSSRHDLPAAEALKRFAALSPAGFCYDTPQEALQAIWRGEGAHPTWRVVTLTGVSPVSWARFYNRVWGKPGLMQVLSSESGSAVYGPAATQQASLALQ